MLTVWLRFGEVLPPKVLSPKYTALMVGWLPAGSVEIVKVACPEPFKFPVPKRLAPSSKFTVPVGVPEPETVAVNVTDCP